MRFTNFNTLDTVQPLKKESVGIWPRPPPHNAAICSLYAAPLPRGVVRWLFQPPCLKQPPCSGLLTSPHLLESSALVDCSVKVSVFITACEHDTISVFAAHLTNMQCAQAVSRYTWD